MSLQTPWVVPECAARCVDEYATIADVVFARARSEPERLAYTFLDGHGNEVARLNNAQLDANARKVAAALRQVCAPGDRVALLFPPGLEFIQGFLGCLYAGVIAVPMAPPGPRQNLESLAAIASDCGARCALSLRELANGLQRAALPVLASMTWLTYEELGDAALEAPAQNGTRDLAFLQYTSGSTSAPKGVMVTHQNIMANERMIARSFQRDRRSVGVGWLPHYHDLGLICVLLQPLYTGTPVVLFSPVSFLKRPLLWLRTIHKYAAHASGAPNFAYELCVQHAESTDLTGLRLDSWKIAFCGAEPVRATTLRRFTRAFEPYGFDPASFYPCYGLAEATLFVTSHQERRPPSFCHLRRAELEAGKVIVEKDESPATVTLVGCGTPPHDVRVMIVDPVSHSECARGNVGEIWVSGANVAAGYFGNQQASQQTFQARLVGASEQTFMRTGDLGYLDRAGELFVTGRLKELIIIAGRNYYPHDIESTVQQCHAELKGEAGAAFCLNSETGASLVLVQEVVPRAKIDVGELEARVRRAIFDTYSLSLEKLVLVRSGTIPKTTSGKVQRARARQLYLDGLLGTGPTAHRWQELPARP